MTINSTIRKAGPFIGNGTASSFPFTYKVFQASDLDVVRLDQSTNVETTLALTTDYTVTLNQDQDSNPGGTVTLVAGALAAGYTLTMTSDVPNLQPTDLTNQGGFYPEVINDSLDRATIQIQQLQEQGDRTLRLPLSSTADGELPPPSANELIGWNSTGTGLTNVDPGSLATVVAYATAYCDVFVGDGVTTSWTLTRNPAVLFNLDVSINGSTQEPTRDYTLTGTTFTMTTPPPLNSRVVVKYKEGLPNYEGDSQDVRFVPAGAGAVIRSAQSKLRDVVSVKDFGAVGDGVTDDTVAIQAAIDAIAYTTSGFYGEVTGKILYFPAGVYKISAPLNVPANAGIHFVGEGKTRSTLWQSINDVNIFNVTGNNFRGGFRGMRLTGNQGQVGGVAKAINIGPNGNQIYVEDCWINTVGYAIYGNPTSDSNFLNNVIEYVLTPIYLAGAGNGSLTINDNVFYNCGPVSQGSVEQRASFEFQSTTQCIMSNNRFVSDAAMSPQTGGYIVVNNVNDFLFTENVMSVSNLDAANVIITNSNKIKLTDNTFPEAWKQQLILNNCTDVVVANNKLAKMKGIGAYGVNLVDVIDVQKLRFIGNTVGEATAYVMYIRTTCEDIVLANNTFDGGANLPAYHTILMENTDQAIVTGNTFRNGNQGRDFACSTGTDLILHGNALDLGFYVDPGFGPTNVYGNVGGVTRTYLNTAPVFGTWKQGDIVWFQQPTAGGFVGAVCVADGTPGTWKTFGAISV